MYQSMPLLEVGASPSGKMRGNPSAPSGNELVAMPTSDPLSVCTARSAGMEGISELRGLTFCLQRRNKRCIRSDVLGCLNSGKLLDGFRWESLLLDTKYKHAINCSTLLLEVNSTETPPPVG